MTPTVNAVADRNNVPLVSPSVSRANKVTSNGKEQGEKSDASPAATANSSKPLPAVVVKPKRGYSAKVE